MTNHLIYSNFSIYKYCKKNKTEHFAADSAIFSSIYTQKASRMHLLHAVFRLSTDLWLLSHERTSAFCIHTPKLRTEA